MKVPGWLAGCDLPAISGLQRFLSVESEGLEHWRVLHGEQHGVVRRRICVLVPAPGRDAEEVALLPIEATPVDDAPTFTFEDVIDLARHLAPSTSVYAGPDSLNPASQGGQHRSAGVRIHIFEGDVVIWRRVLVAERLQPG